MSADRIFVYRVGFAGDILMSTASLRGIREKNPDIDLSYIVWPQYAELLALNPHIDRVIGPGKYSPSNFHGYVDFRHESLMDKFSDTYWGELHAMQCHDYLDIDAMKSFKPEFYMGPGDTATKKSDKICVINTWSDNGLGWRLWTNEKWGELVPWLQEMGYRVVHVGSARDPQVPCDADLRGRTRLAQVGGIMAIADLVIAIDSFVAHVAHANKFVRDVQAKTIELVAGSTPTVLLAGPIAPESVVPTDAQCVPISSYPDCDGPCGVSHPGTHAGKICKHENSCMSSITVDQVLEGVELCQTFS